MAAYETEITTVWVTPHCDQLALNLERGVRLEGPAMIALAQNHLALCTENQIYTICNPNNHPEMWRPTSKRRPGQERVNSIELLSNDLLLMACDTNLLWLDRKSNVVREHAHTVEGPTSLSARYDSSEIAIHSYRPNRLQLLSVPSTPQCLLTRMFSFQRLRPKESLMGGNRFFHYHPKQDLLIYNGQLSRTDSGFWVRQADRLRWVSLGDRQLETSGSVASKPCCFSPDGAWLLIACRSGIYLVSTGWDTILHYPLTDSGSVAISDQPCADGSWLVAISEPAAVNFYKLSSEGLHKTGETAAHTYAMGFIPATQQLIVSLWDGQISKVRPTGAVSPGPAQWKLQKKLDWQPPVVLQEWMNSDSAELVSSLQVTDIHQVCLSTNLVALSNGVDRVKCFNRTSGSGIELVIDCVSDRLNFERIALSPSGTRLVTGRRFQIKVWSIESADQPENSALSRWTGPSSYYYKDAMFDLQCPEENRIIAVTSGGVYEYWHSDQINWRWGRCEGSPDSLTHGAIQGAWLAGLNQGHVTLFSLKVPDSPGNRDLGKPYTWLEPMSSRPCDRLDAIAVSPTGQMAWIVEGHVYLLDRDLQSGGREVSVRSLNLLPCGQNPGQIFFYDSDTLVAFRQGRTALWNWSSNKVTQIQSRGQLVNVCNQHLVWRAPDGVEFCSDCDQQV